LSRCRSLEGIVLHSLITRRALYGDERIGEFDASRHSAGELGNVLVREKTRYAHHLLVQLFTFADLSTHLEAWQELLANKTIPDKEAAAALYARICAQVADINATADKFQRQLQRLIAAMERDASRAAVLKERCASAIGYFTAQIATGVVVPLREHTSSIAYKKKVKRYVRHVQLIEETCWRKIDQLYDGRFMDEKLYGGERTHVKDKLAQVVTSATSRTVEKGGTYKDTLALHRQGKAVNEIAAIRGLTVGTIKSHLVRWIASGEIDVHEVLSAEMTAPVIAFLRQNQGATTTAIRSAMGEKYDYNDIRMILSHESAKQKGIADRGRG
jgi:ATP-dependent DNA helicase PIF1